jgi:DNA-binding HxlR family transcriptional regulator
LKVGILVKRADLSHAPCPVSRSLDVIGDWWSLLIIRDALEGVRRFGGFQSSLGVARGMLATRLRMLVERGLLETAPASDGTAYLEYILTDKGKALHLVVAALRQWGEDQLYAPDEQHSRLIDSRDAQPVAPLVLRAADGRTLDWECTQVRRIGEAGSDED